MKFRAKLFVKISANSCMKMIQIGPREVEKLLDFTKFVRLIFLFFEKLSLRIVMEILIYICDGIADFP